jgi:serine/threonine protein kinase
VRHPGLIGLIGYVMPSGDQPAQIVMEWLVNGSLEDFLSSPQRYQRLDTTTKVKIVVGVCMAMRYFHKTGGIHRDLKPSNVLLDENYEPRVSDFGSATFTWRTATVTAGVGTHVYKSPEADTPDQTRKMDVFSFGMMLWEVLTGKRLAEAFGGRVRKGDLAAWKRHLEQGNRPPLSGVCPAAADLLQACWGQDPSLRSSFGKIVKYLRNIDYQILPNVTAGVIQEYVGRIREEERDHPARWLADGVDTGTGADDDSSDSAMSDHD